MVEVRVGTRDGRAFLEVADRGPGIAPADRGRIFERFVRLDGTRASHPQGSGLGLAIVEQVIEAHGGRIDVRENEGGGTVFAASFPAA
jgi:signal transduction histidine kinase